MFKIRHLFIYKFVLLVVLTLVGTSVISYFFVKENLILEKEKNLKTVIKLIDINPEKTKDLSLFVDTASQKIDTHVSIVESSGSIAYQSSMLNEDAVSVKRKFIYNSKPVYLQLSTSLSDVLSDYHFLWIILLCVFFLVIVISLYITMKIIQRLEFDIKQISTYLNEINDKNYAAKLHVKYFYEFLYIAVEFKNIVKRLNSRDKKNSKKSGKK